MGREGFAVAEEGGRLAYTFDAEGRHLATFDTETNIALWTIAYDAQGILSSVTDQDGLATSIERDAGGAPTAIVGPYGQRTLLTLGVDGWLERIEDPSGNAHVATYTPDGLVMTWADRNGDTTLMTWDDSGRLTDHQNPAGAVMMFDRTDVEGGMQVTKTSPMGRMTTYDYASVKNGAETRQTLMPSGLTTASSKSGADIKTTVLPDGTTMTTERGADPRWGMQAPFAVRTTERLPSLLTRTVTRARTATLSDPGDPFSLTGRTETTTIDGRTWTTSYDVATRTETTTTPAGRVSRSVRDAFGRTVRLESPDVLPITLSYDADGRLETTTQGTRVTTHGYGSDGLLAAFTDAESQSTTFARDANGRVTEERRPDLAVTGFGHDADGATTRVTPPSKPDHTMAYNSVDLLSGYNPPVVASGATPTTYFYDLDKKIDQMLQPGPRAVDYSYDFAGRLQSVSFPGGVVTREYHATSGKLATLSGPAAVSVAYGFDGSLPTSVTWSGDVTGSVTWTYDTAFRMVGEMVNGGNGVAFGYEADDLLVQAGALTLTRDPDSGRLTGTTAGVVSDAISYSAFGEPAIYAADIGGVPALSFAYTRDELGRITSKTETLNGVTRTYAHTYDSAGRLRFVTEGANVLESYDFDPNGNRHSSTNSAGSFGATFDDQDRLLSYGDVAYGYGENGELQSRFDTGTGELTDYVYDALGNLRTVTLPDATVIAYLVDGQGRRVGKSVGGVFEKAWLWRDQLQPVAELDVGGAVVARYVYANDVNAPELMVTSAGTFRLIKDHLGSVRMVVDVATGVIVQELAYDAWGRVLVDTNPGFQPFGFAGGLYDPETQFVRFGARDYNAEAGRWTAKDPSGLSAGANVYAYVNNAPVVGRDPTGLETYQCTVPFELFGFTWTHYFLCVTDSDGGTQCGGQTIDRGLDNGCDPLTCNGSPSVDFMDEEGAVCSPIDYQSSCIDECVSEGFSAPRPPYPSIGVSWWFGTNCEEWAAQLQRGCANSCGDRPQGQFSECDVGLWGGGCMPF